MDIQQRIEDEQQATDKVLAFIEKDLGDLPVRVVAGALLRVSVGLATEVFGDKRGARESRRALENILSQRKKRVLQ